MTLPLIWQIAILVVACAGAFAGGVWWGKLHPAAVAKLLTEADRAAQAVKKV